MRPFSERKGITKMKDVFQVDSMDDSLRNRLWNAFTICYWEPLTVGGDWQYQWQKDVTSLLKAIWHALLKEPIDTIPPRWDGRYRVLREIFFDWPWYKVYDFIEFVVKQFSGDYSRVTNKRFVDMCNSILEEELSAYGFVSGRITQITAEPEIAAIEAALVLPGSLQPVSVHLKTALDLLADRNSPDYRNSIKESISAIEALCRQIGSSPKATLGHALSALEGKMSLHPALKTALEKLYGYTSDEGGIRHSLLGESSLDLDDAKFMLVLCSAFVNYLVAKSAKAGMRL